MRTASIWIIVVLAFVCGCGNDGKVRMKQPPQANPQPNPQPQPQPQTAVIQEVVDASGAVLTANDPTMQRIALTLTVPQGALANPTRITAGPPQNPPQDPIPTLPTEFGPSGIMFTVAATAEIPINMAQIEPGDNPNDLMIVVEHANGVVEIYTNPPIDTTTQTAEWTTTSFSLVDVLFPRHYKLWRQPYAFFDGTPTYYEMGVTRYVQGTAVRNVYHPLFAKGLSRLTIVFGKGSKQDLFSTSDGNVVFLHGVFGSPADFVFDLSGVPNDDDLLAVVKKRKKAKNVAGYQYKSGLSIDENAEAFANDFKRNAKPGCRVSLIGFSMGGAVAQTAVEKFGLSLYVNKVITLGTPREGGRLHNMTDYFAEHNLGRAIVSGSITGLGDILIGSPFLTSLNANYSQQKFPLTEYFAAAGNIRDQNGQLLGHDGLVDIASAIPGVLNLPLKNTFVAIGENHNQLHANADQNDVGKKTIEWLDLNTPPIACAGPDNLDAPGGYSGVINLGASFDPDGDPLTYRLRQVSGPAQSTLGQSPTASSIWTYNTPLPGTYVFSHIVNDGYTDSLPDTMTVTTVTDRVIQLFSPVDSFDAKNSPAFNVSQTNRDTWTMMYVGTDGGGTTYEATKTFYVPWTMIPRTATILDAELELWTKVQDTAGTIDVWDNTRTSVLVGSTSATTYMVTIDCTSAIQYGLAHNAGTAANGAYTFSFRMTSSSAYVEYYTEEVQNRALVPRIRARYR